MDEQLKLILALLGLLVASGLLTYFTKPSPYMPVETKRKRKKKIRLRDAQPYLTEDGFVALNIDRPYAKVKTQSSEAGGHNTLDFNRPEPNADVA
ncbi:hypothetical protein HNV11_06335 [Spirosoma taeanense]|uniref:Uncharacterized protein n=1 Tax=Spirosoma taeanense TaxID=2735870 RepID=A0A6M5Y8F4_9BACT|nr:hypothetical protein [Spirosoma taeanense]QJW89032.1 hypothetical protein HNV11_06335 [Spirosoma taeanense]